MAIDETVSEPGTQKCIIILPLGGKNQIKSKFRIQGKVHTPDQGLVFPIHVFTEPLFSRFRLFPRFKKKKNVKLVG